MSVPQILAWTLPPCAAFAGAVWALAWASTFKNSEDEK